MTRRALALFSGLLTAVMGVFVWIMLDASSYAMSGVLLGSLALVVAVTIIAQSIYALKGPIFELGGRLASREILFVLICFQVVMQFCFGFCLYAVKQTELQNSSFDSAYAYFIELQQSTDNRLDSYRRLDMEAHMPECVEAVQAVAYDDVRGPGQYYRFPVNGGRLLMKKSQAYFAGQLREFALSLLMSLVISVLLMAETVYLAVKLINSRNDREEVNPAGYLRHLAFLFYFTGYLGNSFIPILARDLSGGSPNADFIAGLPYSVEALANCLAILLATRFFQKKGWKPPYVMGTGIFVAGILFSALSPNVYLFIASRAVAGAGYGFCWMTLRNITMLDGSRARNFSSLSSGIYAGIMCSVAFGAVLADWVGYRNVLLLSAAMAAAASLFPMKMRNAAGWLRLARGDDAGLKLSRGHIAAFVVFLAAIVIPTCISEAFCGYVLPLYIGRLQLPTAYVGRVSLVYNLALVYVSSTLLIKWVRTWVKNPLLQNTVHMLLVALALFTAAYLGGFGAALAAAALLGTADGFGFSVQNAYILETPVSKKLGSTRMLTWFSLFKKFGAMLGPVTFGLFFAEGFQGLGVMGIAFAGCAVIGTASIMFFSRPARKPETPR